MEGSTEPEQPILSQLCRCLEENPGDDALRTVLGHRKVASASLDQHLLLSTTASRAAVRELAAAKVNPCLFRALLRSPTGYELPWEVACVAAQLSYSSKDTSQSELSSIVSEVKLFLRMVASSWWEEERRLMCSSPATQPSQEQGHSTRSSRDWMLRLLSAMVNPMFDMEEPVVMITSANSKSERWRLITDAASLTVTLSHEIDTALLGSCLDLVFRKPVRRDCLLPWLQLASNLSALLRDRDWAFAHQIASRAIGFETKESDPSSSGILRLLPEMMQAVFSLGCGAAKSGPSSLDGAAPWQDLIRRILAVSAQDDIELYSRTEKALLSCLTTLSSTSLHVWTRGVVDESGADDSCPAWIECNLFLILFRVSRQSGVSMVAHLVSKAFGGGATSKKSSMVDIGSVCRARMLKLLFPSKPVSSVPAKSVSSVHRTVDSVFRGVSYSGLGVFHIQEEPLIEMLSETGKIVFRSLFPSPDEASSLGQLSAGERGQAWLDSVFEFLDHDKHHDFAETSILFAIVLTVVFHELPELRTKLVRSMLDSLLGEHESLVGDSKHRTLVTTICVIAGGRDIVREAYELNGLSPIFTTARLKLPLMEMALESLFPLPSVKQGLLEAFPRFIGAPPRSSIRSNRAEVLRVQDKVKICLYSLTLLTAKPDWYDIETKAWCLLFGALVGEKRIPVDTRAWLYRKIQNHVEKRGVHPDVANHYLRALTVRLLAFFGPSDGGPDVFLPHKLLASETACAVAVPNRRAIQPDDLNALLRTLFMLIPVCSDNSRSRASISKWTRLLTSLVQGTALETCTQDDFVERGQCADDSEPHVEFDSSADATFYCMYLYIRHMLDQESVPLHRSFPSTDDVCGRICRIERATLGYTEELPSCLLMEPLQDSDFVATNALSYDNSQREALRSGLCELIIEFVARPEWRMLQSDPSTPYSEEAGSFAVGICRIGLPKHDMSIEGPVQLAMLESSDAVFKAFPSFSALVLPAIENILSSGGDFESMDLLLSFLLYILSLVDSSVESGPSSLNAYRLLEAVWNVYAHVAEERVAVRLIQYLEKGLSQLDLHLLPNRMGSIDTENDVDSFIRDLRIRVLRTFLCCFKGVVKTDEWVVSCGPQLGALRKTILMCLQRLSSDLLLGLQGNSGGICHDLFDLYLSSIESCVQCLKANFPSDEATLDSFLQTIVTQSFQAIDSVDSVVCSVRLKASSILKKALQLSTYTLPSLALDMARRIVRAGKPIDGDLLERQCFVLTRSILQCTRVLDRSIEFKLTQSLASWETVSGCDHARDKEGINGDEITTDDDSTLTFENRAPGTAIVRESKRSNSQLFREGERRQLQLHSERAWSWAFCALLRSAELYIEDSLTDLQDADRETTFLLNSNWSNFLKQRSRQYKGINDTVVSLFDVTAKEQASAEISTQALPAECRRMISLSDPAKFRLLSFVERLILAIQRSILVAMKFLRQPYQARVSVSAAVIESVSHLHGWLSSHENALKDDPCAGVLTWYAVEHSLLSAQPRKNSDIFVDGSMIPKLERVAQRVGQLEVALDRFRQEIQALDEEKEAVSAKKLCGRKMLVELVKMFRKCSDCQRDIDLYAKASRKVKALSELRRSLRIEETEKVKKRPWTDEDRSKLERQRNIRSRNQVIDDWLQLDRSIGHDEALEVDAYADLEDFLE